MAHNWSNIEIDNLIELVRNNPGLYDERLKEAVHPKDKDKIWTTIGEKIGRSRRNCKRKWVGLRLKFEEKLKSGGASQPQEDWPWFESMEFLIKSEEPETESAKNGEIDEVEAISVEEKRTQSYSPAEEKRNSSVGCFSVESCNKLVQPNANRNANKLFLESLLDDLCSLSIVNQYSFRSQVSNVMLEILKAEHGFGQGK